MSFKVGDVCEIVRPPGLDVSNPRVLGVECTILDHGDWQFSPVTKKPIWCYECECLDGIPRFVEQTCLRLKRPPSWDKWIYETSDIQHEQGVMA